MIGRGLLIGITAISLVTGVAITPEIVAPKTADKPVVVEEKAPEQELVDDSMLDDYVGGVLDDTDEYVNTLDTIISEYAEDALEIIGEMAKDPSNHDALADSFEQKAEEFVDSIEEAAENYGELQEKAGEIFGEKFDDDTAKSVVSVVTNIFKGFMKKR